MKLLVQPEYQLDRYDFQESYTISPEEDQTSLIQKKAFQFKYRLASNTLDNFQRKNNRMTERHLTRYEQKGIQAVLNINFSYWKNWVMLWRMAMNCSNKCWRNSGLSSRLMRASTSIRIIMKLITKIHIFWRLLKYITKRH